MTTPWANAQLIVDTLSEAVFVLDIDGFIQYANPAATALTGYSGHELVNKAFSVIYSGETDTLAAQYELSLARQQGIRTSEGWRIRKNGTAFWAETTLLPLYDGDQQPLGFNCTMRDCSARKDREIELRKSEEKYRLMVEGVKDYAIFLLDPTGHIMTWNDGARTTKGYTASEIIGRHFSAFYTTEDLAEGKPERELRLATANGKYEEEGWRVKKDGSVFWANVVITSLFNEQNRLIGFSKVTRDLTDRKNFEETLRQSEERFRLLVEQVTDYGIFLLDEKGRIASWNQGAQNINGYAAEEVIGKYFSIFYPEEDILNDKPARELLIARETGKYEEEGWRVKKDGSRFWASVVITAVYNEGILTGYSKVTKDLTERRMAEQKLRESYERYRKLAEALKATNAELSIANQELEQFTSIVSHDLQEPIRSINSFLQLIEQKILDLEDNTLRTYIQKTIAACHRMRELIRNLLQYAQLSKDPLHEALVPLADIFGEAVSRLTDQIEDRKARILLETGDVSLYGNKEQLVQLLQNLISNAIKFNDSDQPSITVACHEQEQATELTVTDNGIGINESDYGKVFDIFSRLNIKNKYPGIGIGLAICKKIVDQHQGRIWPESVPGRGTTFHITLKKQIPSVLT